MSVSLSLSQTTLPMKIEGEFVIHETDNAFVKKILNGTLTSLDDTNVPPEITQIRDYMFQNNSQLRTVSLNNIQSVGISSFQSCAIEQISMPVLESGSSRSFAYNKMTNVEFPSLFIIGNSMFLGCDQLVSANFHTATYIGRNAFNGCSMLETLILGWGLVPDCEGTGFLNGTKIANGEGYIYVPSELVSDYKNNTYWSEYSSQIRSIDNLEVE